MLPSSRQTAPPLRKRKYHSDDGDFSDDEASFSPKSGSPSLDDDRRAHHNELERRRRDHIKDHFQALKNTIPLLEGEKSSRALILKRAVDYISLLQAQLKEAKIEIDDQKRRNDQYRHHATLGLINQSANYAAAAATAPAVVAPPAPAQNSQVNATANAFACLNLPSTSAYCPSVNDSFKPSTSPLSAPVAPLTMPHVPIATTSAAPVTTTYAPVSTYNPNLNLNTEQTKLLSTLLLNQLIQQQSAPAPQAPVTDLTSPNLFSLHEHQMAVQL
uniref:BHLH domain-containing protein n=1 Tax=Panagrellus redivivus TaxID=6233 RepID=A0A7E4VJ54_PANRE